MNCKVNRNAAEELKKLLSTEEGKDKMIRVVISICTVTMPTMILSWIHRLNMMRLLKQIKILISYLINEKNFLMEYGLNISMYLSQALKLQILKKVDMDTIINRCSKKATA